MDQNVTHESSKCDSRDTTKATTNSTKATIPTIPTIPTSIKTKPTIVKSDPMIIPTSTASTNGAASPSPSKRMRYELFISTPANKSASFPDHFIGDSIDHRRKEKNGEKDDDDDDGVKIAKELLNDDGEKFLRYSSDVRGGFKSLDAVDVKAVDDRVESLLRIKAILPERYNRSVTTVKVLVAKIFDRTKSAIFLQAICETFRPPENFSHLKRVKSEKRVKEDGSHDVILHVIICDIPTLSNISLKDNLEADSSETPAAGANFFFAQSLSALTSSSAVDLSPHVAAFGSPYLTDVSDSAPLTRAQYETARALWPCTFHEDKKITSLIDGCYFSASDADVIRANLSRTLRVSAEAKEKYGMAVDCDACMVVDPRDNAIVAIAHDLCLFDDADDDCVEKESTMEKNSSSEETGFKVRPYYHASMIGIDLVAASQGGGAYNIPMKRFPLLMFAPPPMTTTTTMMTENGLADNRLVKDADDEDNENDDGSICSVTYLCTGYDVYLSKEPCLMCAMSLIHSRIRRLFYRHKTPDGALGSKFSIHTLESLNHHFEVFCLE